jgi:pyruvate dehydrogenase complex dehydrogenase (E1) component
MIRCQGRIELDRELSFTQAQTISQITSRSPLELTRDGRAIQWNKKQEISEMVASMVKVIEQIARWKINANGVITIIGDKKTHYELIVLKNRIKIYQNGEIRTIMPAKNI